MTKTKDIKKHEDKYWHVRKPDSDFIFTGILSFSIILCIIFIVGLLATAIDNEIDKKNCENGMKAITEDSTCFANDDFNKLNFGYNIRCTCFYDSPPSIFPEMKMYTYK